MLIQRNVWALPELITIKFRLHFPQKSIAMIRNLLLTGCRTPFVILFMLLVVITTHAQHKKARVLFVGNSYTYVNDLPKLVANMAASTGDTLEYDMSAPGGAGFFNHVDPSALSYIHTVKKTKAGWVGLCCAAGTEP